METVEVIRNILILNTSIFHYSIQCLDTHYSNLITSFIKLYKSLFSILTELKMLLHVSGNTE